MTFCLTSPSGNGRLCVRTLLINTWRRHPCATFPPEEPRRTRTLCPTGDQVLSRSSAAPLLDLTSALPEQSPLLLHRAANGGEVIPRLTAGRSRHVISASVFVPSTASTSPRFRGTSSPTSRRRWSGSSSASTKQTPSSNPETWAPSSVTSSSPSSPTWMPSGGTTSTGLC